jgi:hypothetical protein
MDGWNGSDVCYGRASALNVSVSQRNGTRDGQAESCATGKNLRDAVQKSGFGKLNGLIPVEVTVNSGVTVVPGHYAQNPRSRGFE